MSRYRGPKKRIIRKLGPLPGLTNKSVTKPIPPGEHGPSKSLKKSKISDYNKRLQEKQKVRYNYGLTEKQLFNYIKEARRLSGETGLNLIKLLEMRLDNIVYKLNLAKSISAARQFVTHGHIKVNNKRVNVPSFSCKPKDIITVNNKTISIKLAQNNIKESNMEVPSHLKFDNESLSGQILSIAERNDINLKIKELLIVEFYSRK